MYAIREFLETEKGKKDALWFSKIVTMVRMVWSPLISQDEAARGMAYLFGYQDMDFIKNLFQNVTRINLTNENKSGLVNGFNVPIRTTSKEDELLVREMCALNFKPLPIWEKRRNVIVAENKKMGVVANVRSEDPSSTAKKMQDKGFIEHKKEIEDFFSYIYTSIGQQPYSMKDHEARFGEKHDNGNTDQFESMGLDSGDPADVHFFMTLFHKLREEIGVQNIINFISSYNQWNLDTEKWVNDLLAKKALAATCYVSNTTGAIMTKYLAPETVYIYGGGNRQDFNDANAKGYEIKLTIKQVLDLVGEEFDMEAQWNKILQAITYINNIEFTGVETSYRGLVSGTQKLSSKGGVNYNYNDFMTFKVAFGLIEVCTQNQEVFGTVTQEKEGYYENNQSTQGKYPSKAMWETPTYKAYYMAVSAFDQVLFDFGPLQYQDILGASDFNMNFTIVTYKEVGDSLTIQSAQIIDMVNEAWYKFRYELRRAKPRGRHWNYDTMISSLMEVIPDTSTSEFGKLQKLIEMLDASPNEISAFPKINGITTAVAGNQYNYDLPNGMSKESMLWWEIMMNGIAMLDDMIGMAPLREGDPGNPRDSMNNQFKALESSQESTYYIPDMLTYLFQQLSVKTVFYTQDIVTYKKYNTVAYKFLEDGVGAETLETIEKLGKTALHRFGIFIESLNQTSLRQQLDAMLFEAKKNNSISTSEWLMIKDMKSVKAAIVSFAFFEQRNKRMLEKSAQAADQRKQDMAMQQILATERVEKMKIDGMLLGKQIEANAGQQEHLISAESGVTKAKMKIDGDTAAIYHAAYADFLQQSQLLNQTGKNTPMPAPPLPQPPMNNGAPPPEQNPNTAQQLQNNAVTQPTGAMPV